MTSDLDSPGQSIDNAPIALPRISTFTMIRLGLFQMGLGMMSVLLFGLLNRILIKELGVPGTIASLILAATLFVAPARIWFGQLSDTKPLFGLHRTNYVLCGAVSFATLAFLAVQPLWAMGLTLKSQGWDAALPSIALSTLLFAAYGIAVSASSTPFATLLVDITDEEDRSKIVAIDWSMLLCGTIAGGITIGALLTKLGNCPSPEALQAAINRLFLILPWVVVVLAFVATWGVERKYSRFLQAKELQAQRGDPKESVTLDRAWKILTANPQTRYFFTFLVAMTLGLFLQDAILEPYGGDVFGLTPGETAKLNVPYGIGTVAGILIAGFFTAPRIGKRKTLLLGCWSVAFSLLLLIGAGVSGRADVLKLALLLFGLASGTTTTGAITLMLDLTATETAGTFIGAWGLSQALARGLATIGGGGLLDFGSLAFGSKGGAVQITCATQRAAHSPGAYALVLAVQALVMVGAIGLLSRVNVQEFKARAEETIAAVIQNND
jgi:MFS transporter, BCD family, chlorophyll transporter